MKFAAPLLMIPFLYYNQTMLNAYTESKAKTALIEKLQEQRLQSAEAQDYAHVARNDYYLAKFLKGASGCTCGLGLMVLKDGTLLTLPLSAFLLTSGGGLYTASYICKKISDHCDNCSHNRL